MGLRVRLEHYPATGGGGAGEQSGAEQVAVPVIRLPSRHSRLICGPSFGEFYQNPDRNTRAYRRPSLSPRRPTWNKVMAVAVLLKDKG
jgi:hypothetical protein